MRSRSLARLALAIVALGVVIAGGVVMAGTSNLVYTAGQSTAIQTQLIPRYNRDHCEKFGAVFPCTSSDLVTGGCNAAANTIRTIVFDSCTIFTTDVTGEAAFLKEVANIGLVTVNNRLIGNENAAYTAAECSRFKALSQGNKDSECTLRGLPTGCSGPCP